jgi:glutamine synthetase type III
MNGAPKSLDEVDPAILDAYKKLGIPLRTRHREVAPNQYEFAPMFGSVTTQTDQNVVVMQVCARGGGGESEGWMRREELEE